MIYKYNESISPEAMADLRESVGWNRMEKEYGNPLMISFFHIAVYDGDQLVGYVDSVSNGVTDAYIFEERLKPFYDRFGFNTMLCGQMETY